MSIERKETFNLVPSLYDEIRPDYPEGFLRVVENYAALKADSEIVEVGIGTGQATKYFAGRSYKILGIELGTQLADFAREKFKLQPHVTIENVSFEDWKGGDGRFQLFLSAQAFHWINPSYGVGKAASVVRQGGAIALLWNLDVSQHSEFWKLATPLHEKYFPTRPEKVEPSLQDWAAIYQDAVAKSTFFGDLEFKEQEWNRVYTADEWIKLRNTFSPDLKLSKAKRHQFHSELRELINSLGGKVTRYYRSVAVLGRKL